MKSMIKAAMIAVVCTVGATHATESNPTTQEQKPVSALTKLKDGVVWTVDKTAVALKYTAVAITFNEVLRAALPSVAKLPGISLVSNSLTTVRLGAMHRLQRGTLEDTRNLATRAELDGVEESAHAAVKQLNDHLVACGVENYTNLFPSPAKR